jgi:hypothetical protein
MSTIGPGVPDFPSPPRLFTDASAEGLAAGLERWATEARVDEARAARSRQRWLEQQAQEQASLLGVLCDLAEQRTAVVIETAAGARHRGAVEAVARDFAVIRLDNGREVLLARAGLAAIRPAPGAPLPVGDRPVDVDLRLAEALAYLAAERPRVLLVTRAGEPLIGTLRSVGRDVVSVTGDGDARAAAFVPIDAIVEVGAV